MKIRTLNKTLIGPLWLCFYYGCFSFFSIICKSITAILLIPCRSFHTSYYRHRRLQQPEFMTGKQTGERISSPRWLVPQLPWHFLHSWPLHSALFSRDTASGTGILFDPESDQSGLLLRSSLFSLLVPSLSCIDRHRLLHLSLFFPSSVER